MTIVVKKVPKWLRGFVKFFFGIKDTKNWVLLHIDKKYILLSLIRKVFVQLSYYTWNRKKISLIIFACFLYVLELNIRNFCVTFLSYKKARLL